ncbi:hypothetical protein Tco_0326736 [Tanacetum coccineum]
MDACDPYGYSMEIQRLLGIDQYGVSSRSNKTIAKANREAPSKWLKGSFVISLGSYKGRIWYTKDSGIELTGFSDADYAGCRYSFKSTSGGA